MIGLLRSVGLALAQFDSWISVVIVAAVFFVGQAIEGNFLTPKLVGGRVGLHPVWVMFALLAGGALFGFVGVLLAVPVAAVIGVGVRFAFRQYRLSPYYIGYHDEGEQPGGSDGAPCRRRRTLRSSSTTVRHSPARPSWWRRATSSRPHGLHADQHGRPRRRRYQAHP